MFAGGWALDAAEGVCTGGNLAVTDILDLLASLVDKSLVLADMQRGEARYGLLETVRQYARDRLVEASEEAEVRTRHRAWCLGVARQADAELRGPNQSVCWSGWKPNTITCGRRWSGARRIPLARGRAYGCPENSFGFGTSGATGLRRVIGSKPHWPEAKT